MNIYECLQIADRYHVRDLVADDILKGMSCKDALAKYRIYDTKPAPRNRKNN